MTLGKALAFVFGIFIIGGIIGYLYISNSTPEERLVVDPLAQRTSLEIYETDPFKGKIDAPISVVMAGSFTCPGCQRGATIMDQLLALYPDDVKIIWKDIPENIGTSYNAAVAARCAQQQGRFWQYHDRLFRKQNVIGIGDSFVQWAGDLGLQTDLFETCLNERSTKLLVDRSISDVLALNVDEIPYFEINQTYRVGSAENLAVFQDIIDAIIDSR